MSNYTVRAGDTFETIARKQYGSEQYASLVAQANPGTLAPLAAGTVLAVPPRPDAPTDKQGQARSDNPNEVAVLINGARFRFWSAVRITRTLDGMDTVEFTAPFDPDAPGFRESFKPFSYAPVAITVGGETLFTGTMIGISPTVGEREKTINVSAYSLPGVLNDCTPPASAYPVEFNDLALPEISAALAKPFGVAVQFTGPKGSAFERVAVEPGDAILDFLSDLARQRSLVISSTESGALLFQQSGDTGQPVAILQQGESPVLSVSSTFAPQQYYSHITGLESAYVGTDGSQYTFKNPHLKGVVRPLTFKSPDVQGGDIQQATEAKAGRMYGNMVSWSVRVATWRTKSGALWRPNTSLILTAPGAMVYNAYEFVIRSVSFDREGSQESAELELVLPGAFSGKAPESLPWD